MQQQNSQPPPLDYGTPMGDRPRRAPSPAKKWTLIVVGLSFAAGVLFVTLWYAYVVSLGPMWP
jgi:hypothetical protein